MKINPYFGGSVLLVVLVTLGGGLAAWRHRQDKIAASAPKYEPAETVDVVKAEATQWQPTARLVGTVIAKRSVTLANEIVGVVTEVGFDSGDTVEAGQVLVKFDTSTESADLASAEAAERFSGAAVSVAEASIRVAQSNLSLAKANQRRMLDAAASNSVAATEVDRVNADVDKATADLEREEASLKRAQADRDQSAARALQIRTIIAKKTLKAPFRARAGMRTVHPGQYLAEGTSIVGLTELTDDIYIDFAVPQEYAARVQAGTVVMARSAMLGSDAAKITVVSIDATVNPVTRNVRVRSSVANPGYKLKPGMFVDVEVPVEAAKEYVSVPTTAVRRAAFGDHVFVIAPSDNAKDAPGATRAVQRMVTLGVDIGGRVIVTSGVKAGELIAASGSFKLRPGALVNAAAPAAGAAGGPPADGKAAGDGKRPAAAAGDH